MMITQLLYFHVYLILCLVFYYFILRQESSYSYNRAFLLGALLLSMVLPAVPLDLFPLQADALTYQFHLPVVSITSQQLFPVSIENNSTVSLGRIILAVYVLGVVIQAGRMLWGIVQLSALKREGQVRFQEGISIIYHPSVVIPFSFGRTIYLPPKKQASSTESQIILRHEMAHINLYHALDVWICQLFKIILWWSPLPYIFEYFLRQIHEYQADYTALKDSNLTPAAYSTLLVDYCAINPSIPFVHSFNYSPIKSRIMMLFKKQSNPKTTMRKYRMILPLFIGLLLIQGCSRTDVIQKDTHQKKTFDLTVSDTIITFDTDTHEETMKVVNHKIKDIYKTPDIMPRLLDNEGQPMDQQSGMTKLLNFIFSNIQYAPEARKAKVEGLVISRLIIDSKGNLAHFNVLRSPNPSLTKSVEAMLVKMQSEENGIKWSPGIVDGQPVNTAYILPVKFKLD